MPVGAFGTARLGAGRAALRGLIDRDRTDSPARPERRRIGWHERDLARSGLEASRQKPTGAAREAARPSRGRRRPRSSTFACYFPDSFEAADHTHTRMSAQIISGKDIAEEIRAEL